MLVIPPDQLSEQALNAVLEDYASRDGTDYGAVEASLAEKIAELRILLRAGEVCIVFDEDTESVNLMSREQLGQLSS